MRIFAEVLKRNSVSVHTLAPAPVPAVRREKMMKNSYPTMKSSIARHGPTVFAQEGCPRAKMHTGTSKLSRVGWILTLSHISVKVS